MQYKSTNYSLCVEISVNFYGSLCKMGVNIVAHYSMMRKSTNVQKYDNILLSSKVELKTCTGETLIECGEGLRDIGHQVQKFVLLIIVVHYQVRTARLVKGTETLTSSVEITLVSAQQ